MSGRNKMIGVSVLALALGSVAMPVHGYFQVHGFFSPSNKYRHWFQETVWLQDTRASEFARGYRRADFAATTGDKYPYPDKAFRMTERIWSDASTKIKGGVSDWYDTEVVRQRAEVEEFPPAMDFLAWMYEQGYGLKKDMRKAYMWYQRAKLAGEVDISGSPAKIFSRLNQDEQYFAQLQLTEDIEQARKLEQAGIKRKPGLAKFETVKLHVLEEQRETTQLRKKREYEKKKKNGENQ